MTKKPYFQTTLFKPSVVKNQDGTAKQKPLTLADSAQETYGLMSPTASFRFDPPGTGLKNTQQLNVDFSKFENHTFFNSARNKTHVAIDKVINQFPFDGTRAEHEAFLNSINGFERYVLDKFPKNVGFLNFSRSLGDVGSYLSVKDFEGIGKVDGGNSNSSKPLLAFGAGPFSIEFSLFVPSGSVNTNEIITQRLVNTQNGFTIGLSSSLSKTSPLGTADLVFALTDDQKQITCTTEVTKGKFNHVAMVYDRGVTDKIKVYVDGDLKTTSNEGSVKLLDFTGTTLNIGSGSSHTVGSFDFSPLKTLSGSLDEYRYFLSTRSEKEIRKYKDRELYAQSDLKLYFRFNEPSGSFSKNGLGNNSLTLDYSGNGLHTSVSNFSIELRNTGSVSAVSRPSVSEDSFNSPVLFPSFEKVQTLASNLMNDASQYDFNNPNLITKMVPRHYLDDAAELQGLTSTEGELSQLPGMTEDKPGGNKIKQSQIVGSILYTWAEVFDEIKMFIDEASRLLKVDYVSQDTISDHLLPFLANYHGFSLPTQFNSVTIDQYLQGRQLTVSDATNNFSLQQIQNGIWRRILSDLPYIRQTKGTHASFRSILRNMGINPDGAFRIREYGGSKTSRISDNFTRKKEVAAMINFSGSFTPQGTLSGEGKDSNRPLIMSKYLSGSRTEPGYPNPRGTISKFGSNAPGDGLFTSGSWTSEGLFKFESKLNHPATQSLMRIQTTGSSSGQVNNWLLYNVIARKADKSRGIKGSLSLYAAPGKTSPSNVLKIDIPNLNIFDGNKWHVSFGRKRGDADLNHSSSYFLRVGKNTISGFFLTESIGYLVDSEDNSLNIINPVLNASGAFVTVGSMSLGYDSTWTFNTFLNTYSEIDAKQVNFTGKASGLRFFSKALTKKETSTHVKNFKSVGVENPLVNYSFSNEETGSFERLRVDMSIDQLITESNGSGQIQLFDFSQNLFHGTGTGFESNRKIIVPETFDYKSFEPKFETSRTDNKIRIRSFKNPENVEDYDALSAPLHELPQGETPVDDRRFEVEISAVQALNEDIMNIFATLDFFDNAIGEPTFLFSGEYKDLRNMRRIYFNRLEDKVSFKKFFEFFKWFDMTVGDIFEELVPRTSRYLGTNFVIENHALERPKFTYRFSDMYIGEIDRRESSKIFLQQFIASIKKY